jgi:hypothetical protein
VGLSGGFGVAGNGVAESDSVTVGGENQKFALSVSLVDWAIDVAIGKRVQLGLEFGVEAIDVAHVDVIAKRRLPGGAPSGPVCSKIRKATVSRPM